MEAFGFFYIIVYFIDCKLSIISAIFPSMEVITATADMCLLALCTPVLLFSVLGKLKPRKVYISMVLVAFFSFACGIAVVIALFMKVGPENYPEVATAAFVTSQLPWFPIFRWFFIILGEAFAIYGLISIMARRKKLKAECETKVETEAEAEVECEAEASFEN